MITCNEEMKGNTKCKNSQFAPHFGDLGVMHRVHLWLGEKHTVDFLLAIIELLWLAYTAVALLSEICQNRRFLKGWVVRSFALCGQRSSLLWTTALRPVYLSNVASQGEEGNC